MKYKLNQIVILADMYKIGSIAGILQHKTAKDQYALIIEVPDFNFKIKDFSNNWELVEGELPENYGVYTLSFREKVVLLPTDINVLNLRYTRIFSHRESGFHFTEYTEQYPDLEYGDVYVQWYQGKDILGYMGATLDNVREHRMLVDPEFYTFCSMVVEMVDDVRRNKKIL